MLEGRSCLVSRALPSSCEQESQWAYMTYRVEVELSSPENNNGNKRPSDIDPEDIGGACLKKITPTITDHQQEEEEKKLSGAEFDMLALSIGSGSGSGSSGGAHRRHAGDQSETDSLIPQLGRDSSIECILRCSRADYGAIASLNRSFRDLIRSGEMYKLRRQKGVVEHWVYFSCRLLEWVAFDPERGRWMNLPRMNCHECFMCSDKESLAVGTELLVFGKDMISHMIYKYSILTNSWTTGVNMNSPRCLFGSASLGEIAVLAGGCDSNGNILGSAELYDSLKGMWVTLPPMHKARKMCSGVFMDGKFYVIGGIGAGPDAKSKVLTCAEEFDLQTRTWRVVPNMSPVKAPVATNGAPPAAAEAPPLVAVVNNELYAADYADMEVKKYSKATGTWATVGRLPERAGSMNGWGLAFRACGNRLIVIAGPKDRNDGTIVEVNSWVPGDGPPGWVLLNRKRSGSFVYNCAVMGC